MKNTLYRICLLFTLALLSPGLSAQTGGTAEGVYVSNSMTFDFDSNRGVYTTEAYVDGDVKSALVSPPIDIVFVMDKSGAMNGGIEGYQAVYDAVRGLVEGFMNDLPKTDTKAALIQYSNEVNLLSGFVQMNDQSLAEFSQKIGNIHPTGTSGSDISPSYEEVSELFAAQDLLNAQSGRNSVHIVVTFTGGGINSSKHGDNIVDAAYQLKSTCNALMVSALVDGNQDKAADEAILDAASSNYPNARSLSNRGTKISNPIYYEFTNDYSDFETFFHSIAEEVKTGLASITLDKNAVSRLVMSPSFSFPLVADLSDVKVYTSDCTGTDVSGACTFSSTRTQIYGAGTSPSMLDPFIAVSVDGNTIDLNGFDYSANWCGVGVDGNPRGKKLIVEVPFSISSFGSTSLDVLDSTSSGLYRTSSEADPLVTYPSSTIYLAKLSISKSGLLAGESALFSVTSNNSAKKFTIALCGTGSGPVSSVIYLGVYNASDVYTVTEQTGWSWTYTAVGQSSKSVAMSTLTPGEAATLEFGNTKQGSSSLPKNAEHGVLNQLRHKPIVSVDPDVDPLDDAGRFRLEF